MIEYLAMSSQFSQLATKAYGPTNDAIQSSSQKQTSLRVSPPDSLYDQKVSEFRIDLSTIYNTCRQK